MTKGMIEGKIDGRVSDKTINQFQDNYFLMFTITASTRTHLKWLGFTAEEMIKWDCK